MAETALFQAAYLFWCRQPFLLSADEPVDEKFCLAHVLHGLRVDAALLQKKLKKVDKKLFGWRGGWRTIPLHSSKDSEIKKLKNLDK